MTSKILGYYQKFDDILKHRNLDLGKFIYVQKLFYFFKITESNYFFDLKDFNAVLDQIITSELCIHDYKIIIQFLESFKNARYLEGFVLYINERH